MVGNMIREGRPRFLSRRETNAITPSLYSPLDSTAICSDTWRSPLCGIFAAGTELATRTQTCGSHPLGVIAV
ncbi:MAG: hypothetical protein ACPHL6_13275, partial [Rubripirellula sp.]